MGLLGAAPHHVKPQLYRRAATNQPNAPLSVRKATRDFEQYLYSVTALGGNSAYELPKTAMKKGITTLEVEMSDHQTKLFFPSATFRKLRRGRASLYQYTMPLICFAISFAAARLYFDTFFEPTVTWLDFFCEYFFAAGALILNNVAACGWAGVFVLWGLCYCAVACFWALCKRVYPSLNYVDDAAQAVGGTVSRWPSWFSGAVPTTKLSEALGAASYYTCAAIHHPWVCPAVQPTRFQLVVAYLAQLYWQVIPLLRYGVTWQAVGVFLVSFMFTMWLTRYRTVWKVQLQIESQAFAIATGQKTRAMNESTTEKVAACPIITHVETFVRNEHKQMPVEKMAIYIQVCLLITSGWADNRVRVVDTTEGAPDSQFVQDSVREALGNLGVEKRLLRTRNNTAKPNVWRRSVRVIKKSFPKLFDDVQRGQDRTLPGADEIKERYSGVVTGPEFFDITEGFEGNIDDEIGGVSRHLRQLKSLVSGEYIDREISQEATARLERATDIICSVVDVLASMHFLSVLEWTLPAKWGNQRSVFYQRCVELGCTVIFPFLTGFVKTCELALPLSKLPRLVGSMGMLCCAKDAAVLCSVEQLFKKFMPHVVIKGVTQDGIANRFAAFCRRAKRLGLRILSIDMSAMDSSWTEADRRRVRKVMGTVVDRLQTMLDAELQADYVSQCGAKRRALRWMLKYIEVQLAADDAILFSGERGTSIGNRILMLIVFGAELLRVYGDVDGERKIRNMLHCPPEAYKTSGDERPHGRVEIEPEADKFPDDPEFDMNMGDGDDCTLALMKDMYASVQDFVLAWEAYYKLVEPCSAWDEDSDMECLSLMCIHAKEKAYFVPKVQRNAQRLIAHKIRVLPGKHFAEGTYTYIPIPKEYAEIATDLWQRSYALKQSMVVRHLCRAMFDYCYSKVGDVGTVYDDDLKRLGKLDGDMRLSECAEEVAANSSCDVNAWIMIKATNFSSMHTLSPGQIKSLKQQWYESDQAWSELTLTDDLCAHADVLLTSCPISPDVAAALGFKDGLIEQLKQQLVKAEGTSPEMRDGLRTGSTEESRRDTAEPARILAASVIVTKDGAVLTGYEPQGKLPVERVGMFTFPGGKLDPGETYAQAACRELDEEAGLHLKPEHLVFVREHDCGKVHCKQFTVDYLHTTPSATLTADRLTDLQFRVAKDIHEQHAPAKIANCVKEVIGQDGAFTFDWAKLQRDALSPPADPLPRTASFPADPPGHVRMNAPAPAVVSSHTGGPSCEVKAAPAEGEVTGPSRRIDCLHGHNCPLCGDPWSHKHPHDRFLPHKPRKGQCKNKLCDFSKPEVFCQPCSPGKASGVGALTSREQGEGRQPPVSSPVNGCDSASAGAPAGKGKGKKQSRAGLSHPADMPCKRNDASGAPESKGQARGKGLSYPLEQRPPQTGPPGLSIAPDQCVPGIQPEVSRASDDPRGSERARISGGEHTEPRDTSASPQAPGEGKA
jgi:8-oxo-dGTP pyrophosphatase MutT (NUDIX family)